MLAVERLAVQKLQEPRTVRKILLADDNIAVRRDGLGSPAVGMLAPFSLANCFVTEARVTEKNNEIMELVKSLLKLSYYYT